MVIKKRNLLRVNRCKSLSISMHCFFVILVVCCSCLNASVNEKAQPEVSRDKITFFVLGDPQLHEDFLHVMVKRIAQENPDFVLILGDCCMAKGPDSKPWNEFFEIFSPLYKYPNDSLYAIPGNHDMDSGLGIGIKMWQSQWDLPEPRLYYSFIRKSVYVAGLFVTAQSLFRSNEGADFPWPVMVGNTTRSQLEWLQDDLQSIPPSIKWKIIFHHEPGPRYGFLSQGHKDLWVSEVSSHLEPLVHEAGVDILIRGHHHLYERTYPIDIKNNCRDDAFGTTMITSGGGNSAFITPETFGIANLPPWYDAVFETERLHYCKVVIEDNTLTWEAIDLKGDVFDRFEIEKTPDGRRIWKGLPKEKVLLEIVNQNTFRDSPVAMSWGDGSPDNHYVVSFDVPAEPVNGGMDFSHPKAYLAVNDAFMTGLRDFTLSFWFEPRTEGLQGLDTNGNGGVLICSNWATLNKGDWLIGFHDEGSLLVYAQILKCRYAAR